MPTLLGGAPPDTFPIGVSPPSATPTGPTPVSWPGNDVASDIPATDDALNNDGTQLAQTAQKPARPAPSNAGHQATRPGPPSPMPSPAPNPGQVSAGRQEIDRLASAPVTDFHKTDRDEQPFPSNWESRLPKETLDAIDSAAETYRVPRELIARILWKESKFDPKSGERTTHEGQGIAGLSSGAMQQLVFNARDAALRDPNNGAKWGALEGAARRWLDNSRMQSVPSVEMAAEYLRYLYDTQGHSWPAAVASYRSGPPAVRQYLAGKRTFASLPGSGDIPRYLAYIFDGNAKRFDGL